MAQAPREQRAVARDDRVDHGDRACTRQTACSLAGATRVDDTRPRGRAPNGRRRLWRKQVAGSGVAVEEAGHGAVVEDLTDRASQKRGDREHGELLVEDRRGLQVVTEEALASVSRAWPTA